MVSTTITVSPDRLDNVDAYELRTLGVAQTLAERMRAIKMYIRLVCMVLQRLLQTRDDLAIEASVTGFGGFFQCQMDGIRYVFDSDCGGHRVHQNETIMVVFWCFLARLSSAVSISVSEKTDLLWRRLGRAARFAVKYFHAFKLLVGDHDEPNFPIIRKTSANTDFMYICIFFRCAMPRVDGELHHREAVIEQCPTKISSAAATTYAART